MLGSDSLRQLFANAAIAASRVAARRRARYAAGGLRWRRGRRLRCGATHSRLWPPRRRRETWPS